MEKYGLQFNPKVKRLTMDSKYRSQVYIRILLVLLFTGIFAAITGFILLSLTELTPLIIFCIGIFISVICAVVAASWLSRSLSAPLIDLSQQVEHATAPEPTLPATKASIGNEIITHAITSLHASLTQSAQQNQKSDSSARQVARTLNILPYPVLGLNHKKQIALANQAAAQLVGAESAKDLLGKPLAEVLTLQKNEEPIVETWIDLQQAGAVNAEQQWDEIKFYTKDRQEYNFDVWARYIRAEESGVETSLMLVDRTLERQHEDMKVDFVAMAAHDLRAPVTVIRGYIETLADELEPSMTTDQKNYMSKLDASASQLSGFINNILNVAKVDRGKLNLSLQEGEWGTILRQAVDQLQIRAKAHGKKIELKVDNALPHVAVDPVSIIEVINNFVDNAIKYSGKKNANIIITSKLNSKSEIETTVQDFGVGIPDNLVGKLFTKYYRSHRTQHEFGGTGLGLFISKAIIDAHHGHVWAQSKVGEGSTFGFSLPPYEKIAAKIEDGDTPTITRGTHGWIKNHSLYRR